MSLVLINTGTERFSVKLKHHYAEGHGGGDGNYFRGTFDALVIPNKLLKWNPPPATGEESQLMRKTKTIIGTTPGFTNRMTLDIVITPTSESGRLEVFVGGPLIDYLMQPSTEFYKMKCRFVMQTTVNDASPITFNQASYKDTSGRWKFEKEFPASCCEDSPEHLRPRRFPREGVFFGGVVIELIPMPPLPTPLHNRSILENQTCDYAIVAMNQEGESVMVGCHKCQLEASSPFFQRVFMGEFGDKEGKGGDVCHLRMNLSEAMVKAALRFIYYSEMDELLSDRRLALGVLEFAYTLEILLLYQFLRREVLDWNFSSDDLKIAIDLFIFAVGSSEDMEMKEKAVRAIKRRCPSLVELISSPEYKNMCNINPGLVEALTKCYYKK